MRDQNEFMRQMYDLLSLAKANESRITKREVSDFCSDLGLTQAQLKLVYDFLDEHNVDVAGHSGKKRTAGGDFSAHEGSLPPPDGAEGRPGTEDSKYLSLYRRELRGRKDMAADERERLYARLTDGDESAVHPVIESHLKRVMTLAGKYKNRGVPLEDLIQEGNLALITAVDMMCGNDSIADVRKELDRIVRARMIELADSHAEDQGLEHTIVAKTNLIHEAAKVLAEDQGRLATVPELAAYTKMTEEEVQTYIDLSLEEIKVSSVGGQ